MDKQQHHCSMKSDCKNARPWGKLKWPMLGVSCCFGLVAGQEGIMAGGYDGVNPHLMSRKQGHEDEVSFNDPKSSL